MAPDVQLVIMSEYVRHPLRSHLCFAFASATVCHCMVLGVLAPGRQSGRYGRSPSLCRALCVIIWRDVGAAA
jgi:hypothetical protein